MTATLRQVRAERVRPPQHRRHDAHDQQDGLVRIAEGLGGEFNTVYAE